MSRLAPSGAARGRPGGRGTTYEDSAAAAHLAVFGLAALGAGLARAIATSYLPVLLIDIRDAPGLVGTVMLVNPLAGFCVPLLVGMWSDRTTGAHGRRRPFILGGAILSAGGLAGIAWGHATSYLLLAALGATAYAGLNAVVTAHRALVGQRFDEGDRPRASGALEVSMLGGSLIGVVAGGALVTLAGWAPFLVAAAALPILATITVLRVRERPTDRSDGDPQPPVREYIAAARRPGVPLFLAGEVLWVFGYVALPVFFILYAGRVLGLDPFEASLWLAGFGVAGGVTALLAGMVKDVARQRVTLASGAGLMAAGAAVVATSDRLTIVAIGLAPAAAGFGLVTTLGFPVLSVLAGEGEDGRYSALYTASRAIASVVALPAAGALVALTGSYRSIFVMGAVAAALAVVPLAALHRRHRHTGG